MTARRAADLRVTVIGTGIAGAGAALGLSRRGVSVTIVGTALPGNNPAGEATAAGAGIIAPWTSRHATGAFYELSEAAAAFYPEMLAVQGVTGVDYRRTGALTVGADPALLDEAETILTSRVARGVGDPGELRRLDTGETTALVPVLDPGLGGLLLTGGARVDGRSVRDALLTAAESVGAQRRVGTATVSPDGAVVLDDGSALPGDAVVVAAGCWTDDVLAPSGARTGIVPQRGQISHLGLSRSTDDWPSTLPVDADHYLVFFGGSRVVAGATRESGSGYDARVTVDGQIAVLDDATAIAPGLRDATLLETRVGLRPVGPVGVPVIGPVPGVENCWVVSGFGAAGLTIGPLVGDCVAEAIASGVTPSIIAPFAP